MTAKVELLTPSGGKVILDPTDTAVDRVLTLPATGATLLTDSAGILNIGSGQVVKDANGNLGIGTSSPIQVGKVSIAYDGATQRGSVTSTSVTGLSDHLGFVNPNGIIGSIATDGTGLVVQTNGTERARIDASGNLLVGTTAGSSRITALKNNPVGFSTAQLELISSAGDVVLGFHAGGATAVCLDHLRGGGSVRCVNLNRSAFAPLEASAFVVNSDYRLKENVQPLTHALERLAQIPVHRFSFIKDSMSYADGAIVDGFIAHEVQAVVPEAITGTKDAVETVDVKDEEGKVIGTEVKPVHQGIDQSKLVPLLTAAIQEQQTLIQALTARIEALEVL